MSITLMDILSNRKAMHPIEPEDATEYEEASEFADGITYAPETEKEIFRRQQEEKIRRQEEASAEVTARYVKNMKKHEKIAAVREIPTDILQNEISRRLKKDHEAKMGIKEIVDSWGSY